MASSLVASNIFELARSPPAVSCHAFDNIFRLQAGQAACHVSPELSRRFGELAITRMRADRQKTNDLEPEI